MKKTTRKKGYYVSAILGERQALVAGPFKTHAEALGQVEDEREKWAGLDPRASFAAWGTCRVGLRGPCGCKPPHNLDRKLTKWVRDEAVVVESVEPAAQFVVTEYGASRVK